MKLKYLHIIFFSVCIFQLQAQNFIGQSNHYFTSNPKQKFGFDSYHGFENSKYQSFKNDLAEKCYYAHKSIGKNETDFVDFVIKEKGKFIKNQLKFKIEDQELLLKQINDTLFSLELPKAMKNYQVIAYYKEKLLAKLKVSIFQEKFQKVVLVPLVNLEFNELKVENEVNKVLKQANFSVDLSFKTKFKSKVFNDTTIFSNPEVNHIRYTGQMRLLRDLYFAANPNADKKTKYIFVINSFPDSAVAGFMVRNKSLGFTRFSSDEKTFAKSIAKTLAYGIARLQDYGNENQENAVTQNNLMDVNSGAHLTFFQWEDFQNSNVTYSFYDNDEFVKTNNGTVAYYFWEEDEFGNIIIKQNDFLNPIKKPYKKNYLSYRFNVKYAFLKPFYKLGTYYITIINFILLIAIFFIFNFFRKRLKRYWEKKLFKRKFWRRVLYLPLIAGGSYLLLLSFDLSNLVLDQFIVVSGPIPELGNAEYKEAKMDLLLNKQLSHKEELGLCTEILVRKNNQWSVKKRKAVLYFEFNEGKKTLKYINNSDSLILPNLDHKSKVSSHYFVINYKDSTGKIDKQEVYNHFGKNISDKLKIEDAPKRILVFVNGYRPTSLGKSIEENFSDIKQKGLEFQDSKNVIYDFDRYDYWEQWNQVNLLFQNRINPNDTYYADGHFSVSTSDYRSLINFTSFSSKYPKRCSNPKKHTCYYWGNPSLKDKLLNDTKTINQLRRSPNRKGFQLRREKGRLAGRNLLQVLNDIPNRSENDTLFLVAHSMGFAYSLGIVDELKGKINFGGFYIIAPENAKSGKVNQSEWQEIWQYGVNLEKKGYDAPCLQDGVAPQSKIAGLSKDNRVYFPKKLYTKKGFFDSHFIGNYTWILKIPQTKKGAVKQR